MACFSSIFITPICKHILLTFKNLCNKQFSMKTHFLIHRNLLGVTFRLKQNRKEIMNIEILTSNCRRLPEGSKRREMSQNLRASFLWVIQSFYFVTSSSIIHQNSPSRLTLCDETSHFDNLSPRFSHWIYLSLKYFLVHNYTFSVNEQCAPCVLLSATDPSSNAVFTLQYGPALPVSPTAA